MLHKMIFNEDQNIFSFVISFLGKVDDYIFIIILDLLDMLQWDPNRVYILDKPRTRFASITIIEPTLGLGHLAQYISYTPHIS